MTYQFDLQHRAERCVDYANDGNAVILKITEDERATAQGLVGDAPVIVATGAEALRFLRHYMAPAFRRK